MFTDRPFDVAGTTTCPDCAQLTSAANEALAIDIRTCLEPDHVLPTNRSRIRARMVGNVVVLEAAGRLGDLVGDLDHATRFALAASPRAVIYELSQVSEVDTPGALRALALNGRHPRDWPGVPLVVAGLDRPAGNTLQRKPLGSRLVVSTTLDKALSAVLQAGEPTTSSLRLAPHPTAPRAARDFVTRTLLDWRLSRQVPTACTVVSEMVTNAMIHAGTPIGLSVSEHRNAIRVTVRDHSPAMPVRRDPDLEVHGRGLMIVAGLSNAWGVLPHADGGKVVWAMFDASLAGH